VWGRCYGFSSARDPLQFAAWLKKAQLDTSLYFVGYPEATPSEVRKALKAREGLIRFARTHQYLDNWQKIRKEYVDAALEWFDST
jgi:hypothetical protein